MVKGNNTQSSPSACLTSHRSINSRSPTSAAGPSHVHITDEVVCFVYANHDDRLTSIFNNLFFVRNIRGTAASVV